MIVTYLTNEDKQELQEQINETLEAIEESLDAIIAIQNELIGGVNS